MITTLVLGFILILGLGACVVHGFIMNKAATEALIGTSTLLAALKELKDGNLTT